MQKRPYEIEEKGNITILSKANAIGKTDVEKQKFVFTLDLAIVKFENKCREQ